MHTLKNIFVHPSHIKNFKAKEEDIIFTLDSMNVDSLVRVYKQLRWMKEGLLESKSYGICSNLKNSTNWSVGRVSVCASDTEFNAVMETLLW